MRGDFGKILQQAAGAYNFHLKNGFVEDENMAVMFKNFDE